MAININFKTSQGVVTSRQFEPDQGVSIYGSLTGIVGEPEPFSKVALMINDENGNTIFFDNDNTNLWGDYDFYFRTPSTPMQLTVIATGFFTITGQDQVVIPIGVGKTPAPVPVPETPANPWDWLALIPLLLVGFAAYELYKVK